MTGVVNITVGEQTYTLRYNVFGCEAIEDFYIERLTKLQVQSKHQSNALILYGGLVGEACFKGDASPDYSEAMQLFSEFSEQDDFDEQQAKIDNAYRESKHGKRFIEKVEKLESELEDFKKKVATQPKKKKATVNPTEKSS